ncbi:MAG TPA: GAF domain-containing protein, partial [Anaerolineae bacterium]|nr:GAF domain-containing protein [Anaerolineae bacterium]
MNSAREAEAYNAVRLPSQGNQSQDLNESYLGVPMLIDGEVRAVVSIQSYRQSAFNESHVRLLTTLASSMSVALENARLFAETQRLLKETEQRAAELAIINSVQQGLASKLDMQAIYDLVGDKVCELLNLQTCFIMVYDKTGEIEYYPYLVEDGMRLTQTPIPHDDRGFGPLVMRSRQPLMLNENMAERAAEVGLTLLGGGRQPLSAIYVPLLIGDEAKGVISAQNMQREHAFTEADLRLLTTLASSMSIALENARLFDETQRLFKAEQQRAAELALINSIGDAMVKTLDVKNMSRLIGDIMLKSFNADSLLLMLLDQKSGLIQVPYEYDRNEGGYIDYVEPFPLGTGLASRVITSRQPLMLGTLEDEIANGAYFPPEIIEKGTGFFSQSWLGVPIMAGGQILGLVALADARANAFDDNDLRLLQPLSANVGVALENARLFDETQRLLKETEKRNAELAIINSVWQSLASKLDSAAIYELIGQNVREVFKVDVVDIVMYDPVSQLLTMP